MVVFLCDVFNAVDFSQISGYRFLSRAADESSLRNANADTSADSIFVHKKMNGVLLALRESWAINHRGVFQRSGENYSQVLLCALGQKKTRMVYGSCLSDF